jgi:hypothetical protein
MTIQVASQLEIDLYVSNFGALVALIISKSALPPVPLTAMFTFTCWVGLTFGVVFSS